MEFPIYAGVMWRGKNHPSNKFPGHKPGVLYWYPAVTETGDVFAISDEALDWVVALQDPSVVNPRMFKVGQWPPFTRHGNNKYYTKHFDGYVHLKGPRPKRPRWECLVSERAVVKVLGVRGNRARIDSIDPAHIPAEAFANPKKWMREHWWLFSYPFRSVQTVTGKMGNAVNSRGVAVPIFKKPNGKDLWLPLDRLDFNVSQEPPAWSGQGETMPDLKPYVPREVNLHGTGMYLWNIARVEGGDPWKIAKVAKDAGLTHVLIKIADGPFDYNKDNATPTVNALQDRGIEVWGWQYVYGLRPEQEIERALMRIRQTGVTGFVVNAETQFKLKERHPAAKLYMEGLRGATEIPIGFSSFKYPSYHPQLPWDIFLHYCDVWMPQVYWMSFYDVKRPAFELHKAYDDFAKLKVNRPFFPTGAAFKEHGWESSPQQVTAFLEAVDAMGLPGVNFWEWYNARTHSGQHTGNKYPSGAMWKAMSDHNKPWTHLDGTIEKLIAYYRWLLRRA